MIIAIDAGGSKVRLAVFRNADDGAFLAPEISSWDASKDYRAFLQEVVRRVKATGTKPKDIALALAARLEGESVFNAPNLPEWNGQNPARDLHQLLGVPVRLVNDAAAAALGETRYGEPTADAFLMITWGTGIGSARAKKVRGDWEVETFEAGHQQLGFSQERCGCKQTSCWELACGGKGIAKRYGKKVSALNDSQQHEVVGQFAAGLANLLAVRPVPEVIFSGGVAAANPDLVSKIQREVSERLTIVPSPTMNLSRLGEEAGLYGALALAQSPRTHIFL